MTRLPGGGGAISPSDNSHLIPLESVTTRSYDPQSGSRHEMRSEAMVRQESWLRQGEDDGRGALANGLQLARRWIEEGSIDDGLQMMRTVEVLLTLDVDVP
jgi:hypothetical protein